MTDINLQDDWDDLRKPPLVIPRLTVEELRTFVVDFLAGRVFTSAQVRDEDLGMVFMPLVLGALSLYHKDSLHILGIFYEDMSKALPQGINGNPIFTSCKMMHTLDWARARKAILLEQERQKTIEIPSDE